MVVDFGVVLISQNAEELEIQKEKANKIEKENNHRRNKMPTGKIARLVKDKGFGFIQADGDNKGDLFFHHSALISYSFDSLKEGQKVEFEMGKGPKGPRAENVILL